MTLLSTLVEPLKRELAVPGTFSDVFPDTYDEGLLASLADGFAEAQLRGFFGDMALAPDETDPDDWQTSLDLSAAGGALVILFTGMRIIRAQLRALATAERYKAGPTEYEIERSANLLRDELAFLKERLDDLIEDAQRSARAANSVVVIDNYWARNADAFLGGVGGFHPYEFGG